MIWVLIGIGGWLLLAAVVAPLAIGLGRAAALGDRQEVEQSNVGQGGERRPPEIDRRAGVSERRADERPWVGEGRREDDRARREHVERRRAEIAARRSA